MRIRLSELREIFQKVIVEEAVGNKNLHPVIVLGKTYMIPFGEYDPSNPEVEDVYNFRLLFDETASRSGMVGEFYEDLSTNVWKLQDLNEERTNERFADLKEGDIFYSVKGTRQLGEQALNKSNIKLLPLTKLVLTKNKQGKKEVLQAEIGERLSLQVGIIEWNFEKGSELKYDKLKKQATQKLQKDEADKKRDQITELLESDITLIGKKSAPVEASLTRIEPPLEVEGLDSSSNTWRFEIDGTFISNILVKGTDTVMPLKGGMDLNKRMSKSDVTPLFKLNAEAKVTKIYLPDSRLHRFTMMKKSQRRDSIEKNLDAQLKIRRMQDKLANMSRWLGGEEDGIMVSSSDLESISNAISDVEKKSKRETSDSKRQLKLFPEQE